MILRTDSSNPDFINLVKKLDLELAEIDGDENVFYAKLNTIDKIKHTIILYENGQPIGCGAIREFDLVTIEVKRMYTLPELRGRGNAAKVLGELENWAAELGYKKCILETGLRQPDAIALYKKQGYKPISNYGKYGGIENSVCFEKKLN